MASLNRDVATAHTAAGKIDYQQLEKTAEAERAIKQETIKIVTAFTDEAYRSRFQQPPKPIKVVCPAEADCVKHPELIIHAYATPDDIAKADPNSILAVNGIFNDEQRAVQLAYQNTELVLNPDSGLKEKPTTLYLMYIAPAKNSISELLGVAYEKAVNSMDYGLANFLGYTDGATLYADLLASRGDQATISLGHSRGTLIQESGFTILHNRLDENGDAYTNPNLSVRGVGGAANAVSYTNSAMQIIGDPEKIKNVTFKFFSNDPIAVGAGGNPGVWTLRDLWQVFNTSSSMHSGYGTGCADCAQVEIPTINGWQGTPDGNIKLIRYVGGVRVDANNNPMQPVR